MTVVVARTRRAHPLALYEEALGGVADVVVVSPAGVRPLGVARWSGEPDAVDEVLLAHCRPAVLDVGCGPGRLVAALCARGVPALGIDISAVAVALSRARGAPALRRAVEGRLPGEGRWGTVLLADGNIGIGGNPRALLARCRALLAPGGQMIVEADPDPTADDVVPLELRTADGRTSWPLPWARVGGAALATLAPECGLSAAEAWHVGGRTVVTLRAVPAPPAAAASLGRDGPT